jgi:hypothetical protein
MRNMGLTFVGGGGTGKFGAMEGVSKGERVF